MTRRPAEDEQGSTASGAFRQELSFFLQLLGFSAFAVAQPVLEVMGRSPETFIFRGIGTVGIVVFALVVTIAPAVALWALGAATRVAGARFRRGVHLLMLGALTSAIALQVAKKSTPLRDGVLVALALAAGAAAVWLLARVQAARTYARWTAVAPAAFLVIFLFLSPVSKLVRPSPAGAAAEDADPIPVVMLIFDEFPLVTLMTPSGEINERLFPNFADLAATSSWYRNYTVTEWQTRYSIPSMLTGNPVDDRAKQALAADHPDNLFTLLSDTHRMEVFEPFTGLCAEACSASEDASEADAPDEGPEPEYVGMGPLFSDAALVWRELSLPGESDRDITTQFEDLAEHGGPPPDGRPRGGIGRDVLHAAFLETLRAGEGPALHYLHSVATHLPWNRMPDGRPYQTLPGPRDDLPLVGGAGPFGVWVDEEWPTQLARQRHILQAKYADRILGDFIARLREEDVFDDALVIVTSDHGGSLHAGRDRREPTLDNMHEIYWVPLLIKAPDQREGVVDDRNLMATDLLPTIADLLETTVPWETEGRSALDPETDRGPIKRIVRHPGRAARWPQAVLTLSQDVAQRRIRRDVFVPDGDCRPVGLCPFQVGPGASLVGQPLDRFTIGPPSALTATLSLPRVLRVDADGALPALVLGRLGGVAGPDTEVLVAMNDAVAGVSETWTQDGQPGWFGVLTPEALLRNGDNDLRLFEMEGSVLRPIAIGAE